MINFKYRLFIPLLFLASLMSSCREEISEKEELRNTITAQIDSIEGTVAVAYYSMSQKDSLLINADDVFHAASTMKVPVMIELLKQASERKLNLNDSIVLKNEFNSIVDDSSYSMNISDDSDDIIYQKIGEKFTLHDLMYNMITMSSNLATNVLIELVGAKNTTATMRGLGANHIEVLRGVEDQKAYEQGLNNSTTALDLMKIMTAIADGSAGTPPDCEKMIRILKDQKHNNMIPKLLPKEVEIAHKTGNITGVHHDAAIVYLPSGHHYVLVLLSKDLKDFERATHQLAKISKTFYDYFLSHESN